MGFDALRTDVRDSLRSLRRRPLTTLAAVVTLALGIGLNAAVFAVFDWVLLRPLPFPAAHELVRIFTAGTNPVTEPGELTHSEFVSFARIDAIRSAAAFSVATRVMSGQGFEPAHVSVGRVSGDLFGVLGTVAQPGGAFRVDELSSGAPVAVVSEELWRTRMAGDPRIVGRPIAIDGQAHTVVGVMPAGRGYPANVDVWRPLLAEEREDDDRENVMIARLREGTPAERATLELAPLASAASKGNRTAWAEDVQRTHVRDVRAALTALVASTALILLMACVNVASLLGARGAERVNEMAVRGALGASRGRLLQQLLTENVLIAAAGGAVGLVFGNWTLDLLVSRAPGNLPRLTEISLDTRIVIAGAIVTLMVAITIGLLPSFRASRADLRSTLGAARVIGQPNRHGALVAVQTAVAVVLVAAAGLLGRSLQNLVAIDHGFDPDRLIAINLYLRGTFAGDVRQLYRDLIEASEATPGVRSAAVALRLPTEVPGLRVGVTVDGVTRPPAQVVLRPVTPRYFDTTGIAPIAGRSFTADDRQTAAPVAIVNATFVRDVLGGTGDAIGATVRRDDTAMSIVGVMADITPAGEADRPALYVPMDQLVFIGGHLLVRTARDPNTVLPLLTARLRAVAPTLALDRIHALTDSLAVGRAIVRFNTQLAATFASLALLLAAIGIYGLSAAEVAARWREIAVRVALGAPNHVALWSVMRPSARALVAGMTAGVLALLAIGNWLGALLYGVTPTDPSALTAAPLLLAGVGFLAGLLAARRALSADPAATLRGD